MFIGGYVIIVLLTCYLIAVNVRSAVKQFFKDQDEIKLYTYLATLVITGSLIIGVSGVIVSRVMDAQAYLLSDLAESPIPHYKV